MFEFLTLIIGLAVGGGGIFLLTKGNLNKEIIESRVLLDRVKKVCKLITVEGEFSEIYHHNDTNTSFFGMIKSEKKALIVVKAKASVGIDIKKATFEIDEKSNTLKIVALPQAEIISLDTDLMYYDLKEGTFNKFSSENYTQMSAQAKEFITGKINKSNLISLANNQAIEALKFMNYTIDKGGWTLSIPNEETKILAHQSSTKTIEKAVEDDNS